MNITELQVSVEPSASEIFQGIFTIKGTLSLRDEVIEFAYRTGGIKKQLSEEQSVRIPIDKVRNIEFKGWPISPKIVVLPNTLAMMKDMPGSSRDKAKFQVRHDDRREAEAFISLVRNELYELEETGMNSVPFKLEDTDLGFTEHRGLLYLEDEFLVFDIQSTLAGITKGERQLIKIEPAALEAVRYKRGNVRDLLFMRPKKEALLTAVPGDFDREVKLKIGRQHRRAAERFTDRLKYMVEAGQ